MIGALWANYFMTLKLFTDTITNRLCDKSSEFVILAGVKTISMDRKNTTIQIYHRFDQSNFLKKIILKYHLYQAIMCWVARKFLSSLYVDFHHLLIFFKFGFNQSISALKSNNHHFHFGLCMFCLQTF